MHDGEVIGIQWARGSLEKSTGSLTWDDMAGVVIIYRFK